VKDVSSAYGKEVDETEKAKIQHDSILRLGVGSRLVLAGLGSAIIWGAIAWALT
jgi:phosphate/sulfate permease